MIGPGFVGTSDSRRRMTLLSLLPVALIAVLLVALFLSWGRDSDTQVAAHAPHAALNFSMGVDLNGDTADDCKTNGGPLNCSVTPGSTFTLKVYLNSLPNGVSSYQGFDILLNYAGVISKENASTAPWPNCGYAASSYSAGTVAFGCVIGSGASPSTHVGLIGTSGFNCPTTPGSGTIAMAHGPGTTQLVDSASSVHAEVPGTAETLTISCGVPGGSPSSGQIAVRTTGLYADGVHQFLCEADAIVIIDAGRIAGFKARRTSFLLQVGDRAPASLSQDGSFVLSVDHAGVVKRGPRDCVELRP